MQTSNLLIKIDKSQPMTCHSCGNLISKGDLAVINHEQITRTTNLYCNKFECFKNRLKSEFVAKKDAELIKQAMDFNLLWQLNKLTWEEYRK